MNCGQAPGLSRQAGRWARTLAGGPAASGQAVSIPSRANAIQRGTDRLPRQPGWGPANRSPKGSVRGSHPRTYLAREHAGQRRGLASPGKVLDSASERLHHAFMGVGYFNPYRSTGRRWHCTHFDALLYGSTDSSRSRPRSVIMATPAEGIGFFEPDSGSNDVPDAPVAKSAQCPQFRPGECLRTDSRLRNLWQTKGNRVR